MNDTMMDLLAYRCVCRENTLYCLEKDFNLLFSLDTLNGEVELVDLVPENDVLLTDLCGSIGVWNEQLILTPGKNKKIWLYDLVSRQWDGIPIKETEHCMGGSGEVCQVYPHNGRLFLVGGGYPAILCLDPERSSCDYIEEPYKDLLARHPKPDYPYFRSYGVQREHYLYLASCLDHYVLKFDMNTWQYDWIEVGDRTYTYSGIAWDGTHFWLSPRYRSDIVKWDGGQNTQVFAIPADLKQNPTAAWDVCIHGNSVVFPTCSHTHSFSIDIQSDSLHVHKEQYPLYAILDNGMAVFQTTSGDLSIDMGDSTKKTYHPAIGRNRLKEFFNTVGKERGIPIFRDETLYDETAHPILSLDGFLSFAGSRIQDESTSGGAVGTAIWKAIR